MVSEKSEGRPCNYHQYSVNFLYSVSSHEFVKEYSMNFLTRSCDCKRWQLSGIPCHHAIACCREDNNNPENLVHLCYTVDAYNRAYGFNLVPMRGREFWEKVNVTSHVCN
jgi:hypothetical protein